MSDRAVNNKTVIDPVFVIPEGAEDIFTYSSEYVELDSDEGDIDVQDFEDTSGDTTEFVDDGSYEGEQIPLATPEEFTVLSQTLRRAPGGQQVVDVTLQITEVIGATNYEIQVTKL